MKKKTIVSQPGESGGNVGVVPLSEKDADIISNTPELQAKEKPEDLVTRMATASELANNPEIVKEVRKYGSVPVIYAPTRNMVRKPADSGLKDLIRQATTVVEVNNLLTRGKTEYKNATPDTVRKWEKTASKRISQLTPVSKLKKASKKKSKQ